MKSNQPIKTVYSPSHKISVTRIDGYNVVVSYEKNNVKPDKDFRLIYTISEEDFGLNLVSHKSDGLGYFMLLLAPKYEIEEGEIIAKDIVFVLDKSGSMSGEKIKQAKEALKFSVNSLNKKDRFNLITFSDTINKFYDDYAEVTSSTTKGAVDFIDKIDASGGTNIHDALGDALRLSGGTERPSIIVFLTDGKPTVGITDIKKILDDTRDANKRNTRIFVFGVGYDVNTHLLDKLSDQNNGVSVYVEPDEDIEVKVSNFMSKISNPVLSDLELKFDGVKVYDLFPKKLPDLFKGSQLTLFGRYSGHGSAEVTLTGKVGDETKTYSYDASFPEENNKNTYIPRLWASRKIGYLLDEIRLHGEDKELVDEIINLSLTYGIITPYTSFLVKVDYAEQPPEAVMAEARSRLEGLMRDIGFHSIQTGSAAVKSAQTTQEIKEGDVYEKGSADVEHVGLKSFFKREGVWTDNTYTKGMLKLDVKYDSDGYYQLLNKHPDFGQYLSLGKKVTFCVNGKCFSIGEEGKTQLTEEDMRVPGKPVTVSTTLTQTTTTQTTASTTPTTTLPSQTTSTTIPGRDDIGGWKAILLAGAVVGVIIILSVVALISSRRS